MNESGGAAGTPKKTKSPKGNNEVPILNINSTDEESIRPKAKPSHKAESKLILDYLENNKTKCNRCKDLHKNYSGSDKTNRLRYRSMVLKHLRTMHKIQSDIPETPSPVIQTTSTNTLMWESDMEFSLEPETLITNPVDQAQQDPIVPSLNNEQNVNHHDDEENNHGNFSQYFTKRKNVNVPQVAVRNRFEPLQQEENDDMDIEIEDETTNNQAGKASKDANINANNMQRTNVTNNNSSNETVKNKNQKPPPIIISGVVQNRNNFEQMTKTLSKVLTKGYNIKYTKNNTVINAKDLSEYKKYKKILEETETEWHTYATVEEKTHAFVIKGLDHRPSIEDIKYELMQTHNVSVKEIYIMETRYRPLYLVITSVEHKLLNLRSKIRLLNNTAVQWERRRQANDILQCRKCNMWGHATSHCHRVERCAKCAGFHKTDFKNCNLPEKCSNCNGNHKANDRTCPVYLYQVNQTKANQTQTQRTYRDAPPPETNAWETRRRATQMEQHQQQRQEWQQQQQQQYQQQQQQNHSAENRSKRTGTKNNNNNSNNVNINDLGQAMYNLSQSLNLSEMIRLINDLAVATQNCRTKQEKVSAVLAFYMNIEDYDI